MSKEKLVMKLPSTKVDPRILLNTIAAEDMKYGYGLGGKKKGKSSGSKTTKAKPSDKKKTRKPSAYNIFFAAKRKDGKTVKEISELWKKQKN